MYTILYSGQLLHSPVTFVESPTVCAYCTLYSLLRSTTSFPCNICGIPNRTCLLYTIQYSLLRSTTSFPCNICGIPNTTCLLYVHYTVYSGQLLHSPVTFTESPTVCVYCTLYSLLRSTTSFPCNFCGIPNRMWLFYTTQST